jgi:hypothetical protein
MKFSSTAICCALAFVQNASAFTITPSSVSSVTATAARSSLFSSVLEAPPTETEEVYGTIVGDTKGAALRLSDVAISRGATPLLKNIEWSVQPNERWGIGTFVSFVCSFACLLVNLQLLLFFLLCCLICVNTYTIDIPYHII